jgi:hypothetical protein
VAGVHVPNELGFTIEEEDRSQKNTSPDCDTVLEQYFDDLGSCRYHCDNCGSGIFFYDSDKDADEQ